jgi:hypothetical protein
MQCSAAACCGPNRQQTTTTDHDAWHDGLHAGKSSAFEVLSKEQISCLQPPCYAAQQLTPLLAIDAGMCCAADAYADAC